MKRKTKATKAKRATGKAKKVKKKAAVKRGGKKKKAAVKRSSKKLSPIPEGANVLTPYLIIKDCVQAIEFYKKALGAKERYRIEAPQGRIGHAELKIGDSVLMVADEVLEMNTKGPKAIGGTPVGLHIYAKDVDKAAQIAVDAGMKVLSPVEDQFYGERTGKFEDPFGHIWSISSRVEHVTPREMQKRAIALFGNKP